VALGVRPVIVLIAMTVGGLVGLQLDGDADLGDGNSPDGTPTPTPGPEGPGDATPTPTATPTATLVPTATPAPTVAPSEFNGSDIKREIRLILNDERGRRGIQRLDTFQRIDGMAAFHNENLAGQGFVSHVAASPTTGERYDRFELDSRY
jgi:uncharacterized protein YkwD